MRNVPVLILAYNRPIYTKKLIEALKKIKPKNIYISCDGPKNNQEDINNCNQTRDVFNSINWNCNIKTNYFPNNLGCRKGISRGINWFFKYEKQGIILEDDCIPTNYFFYFCNKMLMKYKNNPKIHCIGGVNFLKTKNIKESYYFSKYNHCWGWATWKNSWELNDPDIKFWPKFKKSKNWNTYHESKLEKKYWTKIFNNTFNRKIDSWAYPWTLSLWKVGGLTVTPKYNLVNNIGTGQNTTHSSFREKKYFSKKNLKKTLVHPDKIIKNKLADNYVFETHFNGKNYLYPWRVLFLIKLFIKNPFKFLSKSFKVFR